MLMLHRVYPKTSLFLSPSSVSKPYLAGEEEIKSHRAPRRLGERLYFKGVALPRFEGRKIILRRIREGGGKHLVVFREEGITVSYNKYLGFVFPERVLPHPPEFFPDDVMIFVRVLTPFFFDGVDGPFTVPLLKIRGVEKDGKFREIRVGKKTVLRIFPPLKVAYTPIREREKWKLARGLGVKIEGTEEPPEFIFFEAPKWPADDIEIRVGGEVRRVGVPPTAFLLIIAENGEIGEIVGSPHLLVRKYGKKIAVLRKDSILSAPILALTEEKILIMDDKEFHLPGEGKTVEYSDRIFFSFFSTIMLRAKREDIYALLPEEEAVVVTPFKGFFREMLMNLLL